MSALTEKIAAEHGGWQYSRGNGPRMAFCTGCFVGIGREGTRTGESLLVTHVVEVTEAAVREHIATEQEDYADATYDLVDTNNGARLAFAELVRIAREGRDS